MHFNQPKEGKIIKNRRLHIIVWNILRFFVKPILRIKYGFSSNTIDIKGPALIISNHSGNTDPLLTGAAFKRQMYYVANDGLVNDPRFSIKLLRFFLAPICRDKAGSGAGTVKAILRALKGGMNVFLFPEGNTTWDGVTRPIPPSTAKFARASGATLVTYRLKTYYLNPRWCLNNKRKGKFSGELVGIYTPEELKAMTNAQVMDIINRDLYYDAVEAQRESPESFTGKELAKGIETFLYYCPKCGAVHTIHSSGDSICCSSCGAAVKINNLGFLDAADFPVDNLRDWNTLQQKKLKEICENENEIFSDKDFVLFELKHRVGKHRVASGDISLDRDAIHLPGGVTIPLSELAGMSNFKAMDLFLRESGGTRYLLKAKNICCTAKYIEACMLLGCKFEFGI